MSEWEREERRDAQQRMFAKFRSLPSAFQVTTSVMGGFTLITLIQAIAGVVQSFITTVLAPLVQWWIR